MMNNYGNYGNIPPGFGGYGYAGPLPDFGRYFANYSNMAYPQPQIIGGGANSWGPAPNFPPVIGGGANSWGPAPNFPPAVKSFSYDYGYNSSEPVGDLYHWDQTKEDTKTEEPKKRRHRREDKDDPDPPEKHVYENVTGRVWGDPHFDGADAEKYDIQGKADTIYNILSDDKVQVNAKFIKFNNSDKANVMGELGFRINGDNIKVGYDGDAKLVEINGEKQDMSKDWSKNGVSWKAGSNKLSVEANSTDGESWKFDVDFKRGGNTNYFDLNINGKDIGNNNTSTAGLWGHSLNNENTGNRAGGGGVLLGPDGKPISKSSKEGDAEHNAALALYVEDSLFSTGSRWNAY